MTNPTPNNPFANMATDIVYASGYGYLAGMLTAFEICVRNSDPEFVREDIAYLLMRFREIERFKEERLDEIFRMNKQRTDALMAQHT